MASIYVERLIKRVIELSQSSDWDTAVAEWEIADCEEDDTLSESCVCGKEHLYYLFTIENAINGNTLFPIGSSCIKKFGRDDLDDEAAVREKMLIVELKAPHVKLSIDVFNQIVRYANTIRKEPRFTGSSRLWKFYAVCAEVEDDVKVKYKNFEHHGKKGLVDIIENFELYALSWDDIFQAFEARHSFLLGKLKLDYSQVEAELGVAGKPPASKADVNALTQKLVAINA